MKAVYAGSFDCYTNGHHDIVKKASFIFDEVHVLIASNAEKHRSFPAEDMVRVIEKSLQQDNIINTKVSVHDGLVAEYAEKTGIKYLIRGLRNETDYQYEENIACINRLISPKLETIYFRTDNMAISSSMIKEMLKYGRDISQYVPSPVYEYLETIVRQTEMIRSNKSAHNAIALL